MTDTNFNALTDAQRVTLINFATDDMDRVAEIGRIAEASGDIVAISALSHIVRESKWHAANSTILHMILSKRARQMREHAETLAGLYKVI